MASMAETLQTDSQERIPVDKALRDNGLEVIGVEMEKMAHLSEAIHPDLSLLPSNFHNQNWEQQLISIGELITNTAPDREKLLNIIGKDKYDLGETKAIFDVDLKTHYSARIHYHETKAQLRLIGATVLSLLNGQDDNVDTFVSQGTRKIELRKTFNVVQRALAIHESARGESLRTTDQLFYEATMPFLLKAKAVLFPTRYLESGGIPLSTVSKRDVQKALGSAGVIVLQLVTACGGLKYGVGEIPTAAGEVQPTETEFYLINEEAARKAILAWNGKELGPGYTLYDVDGDGQIEWVRFLNGLDAVDINKNPPMPAGSMSIAILETMGPDGGAYSFMLLDNMGMGARALIATNASVNPDGTITSDLIDANGILQAHLVVNTTHEEGKAWATIVYTEPDSDSLLPSYELFSTIDTLQFETALSGGKPLFSVIPVPLTPTADVPPTPAETPDPLEGAPEGATDKINGEWVMIKDGKEYRQKTIQVGTETLTYWSTSLVENGSMCGGDCIPLEFIGTPRSGSDSMPLSISVKAGVMGVPIFRQVDNFVPTNTSLSSLLWYKLVKNQVYGLSADQLSEALNNENSENRSKVAINFTTPDGVIHTWLFYQGHEFNWVSWEDMKKGSYWETKDELTNLVYRWTITTAPDGALVSIGAVEYPEQLTPEQTFKLVFGSMAKAVMNRELPDKISFFGTMAGVISSSAESIIDLKFSPPSIPALPPDVKVVASGR